ncbi:hypothetical protein FQN57_005409 [Myotisia sp. PD_48]|nr:hypothetical protein FQN57_005409 [Myotisia sp. PD_48]
MAEHTANIAESVQAAAAFSHVHGRPGDAHNLDGLSEASISTSVIDQERSFKHARTRHSAIRPIPDLRFEQSYLNSLKGAETWTHVAWITIRDQVMLPFIQGTLWTLALSGWRYWNRGAHKTGRTAGVTLRQWWEKMNGWKSSKTHVH